MFLDPCFYTDCELSKLSYSQRRPSFESSLALAAADLLVIAHLYAYLKTDYNQSSLKIVVARICEVAVSFACLRFWADTEDDWTAWTWLRYHIGYTLDRASSTRSTCRMWIIVSSYVLTSALQIGGEQGPNLLHHANWYDRPNRQTPKLSRVESTANRARTPGISSKSVMPQMAATKSPHCIIG